VCLSDQPICAWYFWPGNSTIRGVVNHDKFFKALGRRVKQLRERHGQSQEDMACFGFSARHWQQIEAGRPITMTTLLRICDAFKTKLETVVRGLDRDVYHD
jgi:DNA-binding XRE family transcriptional regulator